MGTQRRGSVALLAMIMVVATAALAITMITLTNGLRTKQTRLETNRIVKNAFDGGIDTVKDMAARGVLRLPQTVSVTVGSVSESLALTDASVASINVLGIAVTVGTPSILVNGTLTYAGNTYTMQQVIGRGKVSSVWQYAIYDNSGLLNLGNDVLTGTSGGGDAWFNGSVTLTSGGSHFKGDLTATGTILPAGLNVDGTTTAGAASITFPGVTNATYQAAALLTLPGGTTLNGYTFFAGDANGYRLIYVNGNLTIKGNLVGSGAFFVTGNVTISGDITKSASDHSVIICPGNITLAGAAHNIAPYIYCGGTLNIGGGATATFTSGIVTSNLSMSSDLGSSFDTTVRDNQQEAWKLKLPGCWP